jgi:eukaryotic-like serine/threonine-protein kinase
MKPETLALEEECPSRDQLNSLLNDELTGDIVSRLEDHVASCSACQAHLLELGGRLELDQTAGAQAPTATGVSTLVDEPRADFLQRLATLAVQEAGKAPAIPTDQLDIDGPVLPGIDVLDVLGRGALGTVYLARHKEINRLVALKAVPVDRLSNSRERERARRGVEAVTHLQHPNIIQIYHVGRHEGWFFGTLEYMEGGSLSERLQGAPFEPREAAQLMLTLTRAVAFVHQSGFVHRDLKPGNILFKADGTPKLADFGLACSFALASDLTLDGEALGTPSYMAPEQARGRPDPGPGVDIYALGAILYELLTGKPPFRGATKLDTLYQVVHLPPVPVARLQPQAPAGLARICMRCLEKDPELRYPTAQALADDLERFLASKPIRPAGPGVIRRMRTRLADHPALTLFTGLLLLVALLELIAIGALWDETASHDRRRRFDNNYVQINQLSNQLAKAESDLSRYLADLAEHELKAGNKANAKALLEKVASAYRDPRWQKLWKDSGGTATNK